MGITALGYVPCVLLEEIVNDIRKMKDGIHEPGFAACRFRRIVNTKKAVEDLAAIVRREFDHAPARRLKAEAEREG